LWVAFSPKKRASTLQIRPPVFRLRPLFCGTGYLLPFAARFPFYTVPNRGVFILARTPLARSSLRQSLVFSFAVLFPVSVIRFFCSLPLLIVVELPFFIAHSPFFFRFLYGPPFLVNYWRLTRPLFARSQTPPLVRRVTFFPSPFSTLASFFLITFSPPHRVVSFH